MNNKIIPQEWPCWNLKTVFHKQSIAVVLGRLSQKLDLNSKEYFWGDLRMAVNQHVIKFGYRNSFKKIGGNLQQKVC